MQLKFLILSTQFQTKQLLSPRARHKRDRIEKTKVVYKGDSVDTRSSSGQQNQRQQFVKRQRARDTVSSPQLPSVPHFFFQNTSGKRDRDSRRNPLVFFYSSFGTFSLSNSVFCLASLYTYIGFILMPVCLHSVLCIDNNFNKCIHH